jgi:hypothetical protein
MCTHLLSLIPHDFGQPMDDGLVQAFPGLLHDFHHRVLGHESSGDLHECLPGGGDRAQLDAAAVIEEACWEGVDVFVVADQLERPANPSGIGASEDIPCPSF